MLSFLMVGCNTMKKLEREAIETAIVGKVSPQQLTAVDGVVNFNYNIAFAPRQFYKKLILKVTPKMQYPGGEKRRQSSQRFPDLKSGVQYFRTCRLADLRTEADRKRDPWLRSYVLSDCAGTGSGCYFKSKNRGKIELITGKNLYNIKRKGNRWKQKHI